MKVMGIDPGTLKMGVGLIEKKNNTMETLFYQTVKMNNRLSLHRRLQQIYHEALRIFKKWHPDVVALEDIYYGISFKSAIRIGEARSAVILAATEQNIDVIEYSPARVKSAVCGFGKAAKVQVQNMVKQILNLRELPPSDAADALALAICHINNKTIIVC